MPVFYGFQQNSPSFGEVANANARAASAESKAKTAEGELRRLVGRVDAMALVCQSMWELLREKTELTDDDLRERMQEVDMRDGTSDGRLRAVTVDCDGCGRPVNSRRGTCIYCGCEMRSEHIFDQ